MRADGRWAERLRWWDGRAALVVLDVVLAAAVVGFDASSERRLSVPEALYVLALCVTGLALLVRRRFPFVVLVVVCACLLAETALLAMMLALYSVAARHGLAWVTGAATALVVVCTLLPQTSRPIDLVSVVAALSLLVVAPVLAGLWMYQRAALLKVLRDRAEEAERNRTLLAEQAVSAERRRIAREMHDVVAHRVTAIALQAGALSISAPDERTGDIAENIRSASSRALNELRGILSVLRESDGADLSDVGTPDAIRKLVGESGLTFELQLPSPWPAVPGEVGRAVYRVVQESLTNAGKHAPDTRADVSVTATESELAVAVTNRLATRAAGVPGSGYGLIGMRERVELAGGTLRTGPRDGRFEVVATFPLGQDLEDPS